MWLKMESFVAFIIFQAPVKRQLRSLAKKLKTLQTSLVHQASSSNFCQTNQENCPIFMG
jgi:NRPS condensation-like uncharacterized protein